MFQLLLVIIYLAFISLGLPDALLGSAWPSMYRELGASVSYAGIISMIIAGGTIISSLFSDRLIRAFGTGKVTVISVAMTAAALFGFSSSHSFIQLCLWAIPYGLGAGSVDAGLNNFVALHYKSRHMSWLHCFWGIGAAAGPYIMGLCLTRGLQWNSGYMVVGVIQIALVACLVLSLPLWRVRTEGSSGQDDTHKQITLREGLRPPGAKAVLTAFFCYCALEATAGLWASSYMVLHRELPPDSGKMGFVFTWALPWAGWSAVFVTDRAGDRNMVRCGQLTAFAGTVLLFLPAGDGAVLAGLIMVGLGCAPIYPSLLHETPDNFEVQYSQSMMGMQMACAYVGSTFMPPLFGVVAERISVTLYPVCLVVFVVLMIGMTERMGRVQDGKVNGLTHAQLLQ
ncbi:MAG: MFS transporter [Enterocloster clostridioformis]